MPDINNQQFRINYLNYWKADFSTLSVNSEVYCNEMLSEQPQMTAI